MWARLLWCHILDHHRIPCHIGKFRFLLLTTIVILGLVYGAFTLFLGVKLPIGLLFK